MIHKFEEIRVNSSTRDNIYVFIDEAHRSVAADLGSYLMAAAPNATIIGFTGTPVGDTQHGSGSFRIFGAQDKGGYLDKYSILESIEDETTLPIKYKMAPSTMTVPTDELEQQFFALAASEDVTDIEELNQVLMRAVGLRTFLGADDRVEQVAAFVAEHFRENVDPLGYKAFVVAVDRETCAKYKRALDKHLPPEWSEVIYSKNPNDIVDRPDVARLQLSDERERDVRKSFKKPDQQPKILIVTDKLLTGYDAPVLYAMYLDKPMRSHVLLQALARVNRPYVDDEGVSKQVGLVVDFVGVLRELKKALALDSGDIGDALQDLDLLVPELLTKIDATVAEYLEVDEKLTADAQLESVVYGRFLTPEARKTFFNDFRDIEGLWEILSPDAALRDHITKYKDLSKLYAAVRAAYSESTGFLGDLEYKTKRLIEESATQEDLGRFSRVVTFDVDSLQTLRDEGGAPEGKVHNLLRGLHQEMQDNPAVAAVLQGLAERADRVLRDLEDRRTNGLTALDQLAALATEKAAIKQQASDSGLSDVGFAVYWVMSRGDVAEAFDSIAAAREVESVLGRFPNWQDNADEKRRLRAGLYKPLLALPADLRTAAIDELMQVLEQGSA
jgi:type I restriction enzyme R subunit